MAIMQKKSEANDVKLESLNFQIRESYKKARTSIIYSVIKKGCKKIAFSSSNKSEGKTLTSVNISIALAQQVDTKVLIIDCDLRRPRVHTCLDLGDGLGVTNYLNFECSIDDIIRETKYSNLSAITYGAVPPNPSELLSSTAMADMIKDLESRFDYIIFDTPPVNVVIDAIPIIKMSDGVVMIAKNRETTQPDLTKSLQTVKMSGGKVLGVIINYVEQTKTDKHYYYKY